MRPGILATPLAIVAILYTIWVSEHVLDPPKQDHRVHITYWEKWTGFEGDAMKATVDEFNRTQDKIFVDLLTVSGIQNKTLLAVAGGTPPDVAGLYGPNVAAYVNDNAVMNLDDYCRRNGISRDQYIPVYWDIGSIDGHQYSLPTTPASTALHYSRSMFRQAGLDPDKPPQTMEEMDAASDKITTHLPNGKIDRAGFMPAEPGWWPWVWGYFFGGKLWNGTDKITANSPENVRAFTWIGSYSKKFGASSLNSFKSGLGSFSSPQNGFLDGKVAMELQGVWMANYIRMYSPKMNAPVREWGAVPFPHPADRPNLANMTSVDEDVLVIPRGAKHPDEAFEFVKFIQSQKGMEMLCLLQGKHSPLKQTSPGFYHKHPNPFIKLFTELPAGKNVVAPPKMAIWFEYNDAMTNAFDEISLEQKTPQQALDAVQARMQPKLDEYLERKRLRDAKEAAAK